MKKAYYFFVLCIVLFSCTVNKKPTFIKVDNLQLISVSADTLRLKANAFFENPNDVGGKIATDEVLVMVNDTQVALVSSDEFKIPAKNEFTIPLKVVIPTRKIFENSKNGFLGRLLNSVLKQSIKIQFKGNLKYEVFGYSSDYPLDVTQKINIKI